jgi:hypothetical protein
MKNMKRLIVVAFLFAMTACFVQAQTGVTSDALYTKAWQSKNAKIGRFGMLMFTYDFATDGGAVGTIDLGAKTGNSKVPDNFIVMETVIDVITPVLPLTSTNALSLLTAADVVGVGTNLNTAELVAGTPVGTVASALKMTNSMPMNLAITGSAATQGLFHVFVEGYYSY